MGVSSVRKEAPEPKASCPSCGRPVAVARSESCFYCRAPLYGVAPAPGPIQVPPEFQLGQDPRAFRIPPLVRNGLRWGAVVLAGVLAWLLASDSWGR